LSCGRFDGFWELKLKPWDTDAGALIVAEASGKLSEFSGKPLSIWGNETLASPTFSTRIEINFFNGSEGEKGSRFQGVRVSKWL
jgi:fructose-1,6-bisphosphatase/inositol monophosphatase family enzyme